MRTLVAILVLVLAQGLGAVQVPSAIRGTWVVTGYHLSGSSALSEKKAKSWIGKSMVIGQTCVSLRGNRVSPYRIQSTEYNAKTYFWETFRMTPSQVGYRAPKIREYLLLKAGEKPWLEPGGAILEINQSKALTVWDGVFFVLTRKPPTKPPPTTSAMPHTGSTRRH